MRRLIMTTLVLAVPTFCAATPMVDGFRLAAEVVPGGLTMAPASSSVASRSPAQLGQYYGLTATDVARLFATYQARDDARSSNRILLAEPSVRHNAFIPSLPDSVAWAGVGIAPSAVSATFNANAPTRERSSTEPRLLTPGAAPGFGALSAESIRPSSATLRGSRNSERGSLPISGPPVGNFGGNHSVGNADTVHSNVPPSLTVPDRRTGNSGEGRGSNGNVGGVPPGNFGGGVGAGNNPGGSSGAGGYGGSSGSSGSGSGTVGNPVVTIPTPPVLWLIGSALIGMGAFRRLRQRQ